LKCTIPNALKLKSIKRPRRGFVFFPCLRRRRVLAFQGVGQGVGQSIDGSAVLPDTLHCMAGDVRGHDLNSWWENRAAYRDELAREMNQWLAASQTFAQAASGAKPAATAEPPGETLAQLTLAGDALTLALRAAAQQLPSVEGVRATAKAEFDKEKAAVESDCRSRVQAERNNAMKRARDAADRMEKSKVALRKGLAILIFIFVAFVLLKY
jgi:hypothetical protein